MPSIFDSPLANVIQIKIDSVIEQAYESTRNILIECGNHNWTITKEQYDKIQLNSTKIADYTGDESERIKKYYCVLLSYARSESSGDQDFTQKKEINNNFFNLEYDFRLLVTPLLDNNRFLQEVAEEISQHITLGNNH